MINSEIVVRFDQATQKLGPLQEAAYRLIGQASCQIEAKDGEFLCTLILSPSGALQLAELRSRFLDVVTDENLRQKVTAETSQTRDLILALAFGALARNQDAPINSQQ